MFASSLTKNVVCMLLAVVIVTASLAVGAMGIQSLETHASVVISA
ncbi:MAG: hypothetical protein ACJ8OJ_13020 [Povalibacter sp.]